MSLRLSPGDGKDTCCDLPLQLMDRCFMSSSVMETCVCGLWTCLQAVSTCSCPLDQRSAPPWTRSQRSVCLTVIHWTKHQERKPSDWSGRNGSAQSQLLSNWFLPASPCCRLLPPVCVETRSLSLFTPGEPITRGHAALSSIGSHLSLHHVHLE